MRDDTRPDNLAQGILRSKAKDTRGWHTLTWNNSIHFVRKETFPALGPEMDPPQSFSYLKKKIQRLLSLRRRIRTLVLLVGIH